MAGWQAKGKRFHAERAFVSTYLVMHVCVLRIVALLETGQLMVSGSWAIPSQFSKRVVELAILTLLRNDEAYGAQIVDRLGEYPGLGISAGTAYPLLSRLKKSGLIPTVWRDSPAGPPGQLGGGRGDDVHLGLVQEPGPCRPARGGCGGGPGGFKEVH